MAASSQDYYTEVGSPGSATTLAAPGHLIAGTSFTVVSTTNWPTGTGVIFAVDTYDTSTGARVPNSYTEWSGVVASSTSITGAVLRYGTDQNYSAGATTRVYIPVASSRENRLVQGLLAAGLTQAGGMGAISPTSVTSTGTITAASFVQTGSGNNTGWNVGLNAPNTVTALGNRSYSMVFNTTDYSTTLSAGTRLRTTRTVAAPTQCTSLNGTTQYYSKTSPAGMTFVDDFVVSAWVKLTSYTAISMIASRYNGTSGWAFYTTASGQVTLQGFNAGSANNSAITSYQSIPLNKWVHVTAQLDMSTFTATTTTSYVMIDGVDVPSSVARGGTNPTLLAQAGNLEIGSWNGGLLPFPGKIAQVAIYSAKVTQATILASMHQTLAGTETSLISAYSFNNTINDLNVSNANNLTANGSAVATNADSPFGGQADGTISSTLDYGIIQKVAFSTNTTVTVQVPEGCTIPTSGGVTSVVYSANKAPYGMPVDEGKWLVSLLILAVTATSGAVASTTYNPGGLYLNIPIGSWHIMAPLSYGVTSSASAIDLYLGVSTSSSVFTVGSRMNTRTVINQGAGSAGQVLNTYKDDYITLSVATPYYILLRSGANFSSMNVRGDTTAGVGEASMLEARNAYL